MSKAKGDLSIACDGELAGSIVQGQAGRGDMEIFRRSNISM